MTGNVKWLKDKQDNIIIPNTLTTSVYNSDGKNVEELLNELIQIQENKVDKIEGKGLSTNDFTNEDKEKLDSIINDPNNITIDAALSETSENPVQNKVITSKLNEVFQSVSDGKSLIASAITDKGVSTDATATFDTMAGNIRAIESGGGNIQYDITYSINLDTAIVGCSIMIAALCYPDAGRDVDIYINGSYLDTYSFDGANDIPNTLYVNLSADLEEGLNTIRIVSITKDIVLTSITIKAGNDNTIPSLTSNETTIGDKTYIVSASSVYPSGNAQPYKPFDGTGLRDTWDCWHPNSGAPQWLMIELPEIACITGFTMQNRSGFIECPKDVIFQGSNDCESWDNIYQFVFSDSAISNVTKEVEFINTNFYKFYRWYLSTVNADYGVIAKIINIKSSVFSKTKILQYISQISSVGGSAFGIKVEKFTDTYTIEQN